MDCVELEHSEGHAAESMDGQLLSLDSPATSNYGDPSVLPRIGDQYQAEMPPLMTELEQLQLRTRQKVPNDVLFDSPFELGLAIPIVWVHPRGDHIKDEREEFPRTKAGAGGTASVLDATNSKQVQMNGSRSQECTTLYNKMNMESPWMPPGKVEINHAVPGSPTTTWSNAEIQSFLLGLYIFGKDLVIVRKFIGCKGMADILSYYYGKFCKSDAHRRWTECRNIRTKRPIHGHRIFTGCRQQEFLLRVLPTKSKEVQDTVQESVSNTRDDGVLEDRDPSYDEMLSKMVGTIKSKPGGRLEMGEAFIVEKYRRPMPKLRSSRADATGSEQKPLPPGTLTIAQLQQIILLRQGKSDEHQGPMEVHDIARKFNIDAAQVEKIVMFVSLPPEEQNKGSQK